MRRLTLAFMFIVAPLIFCPGPPSHAADKIIQRTEGDQSPAVHVSAGGTSTINYNYIYNQVVAPTFSEIRQQYSECMRLVGEFQNKKLEELDKRLAELYAQQTGAADQDAKKWVEDVIRNAPEYKKQVQEKDKLNKEWNKQFSKDLLVKTYNLFTYVLATIDARFAAFQQANPKAGYKKSERFVLFSDGSRGEGRYIVRAFTMPDGRRIEVHCYLGNMSGGLITAFPSLTFVDAVPQGDRQAFSVIPGKGSGSFTITSGPPQPPLKKKEVLKDVKYPISGEEMLTEEFKTEFDATFQVFVKAFYAD